MSNTNNMDESTPNQTPNKNFLRSKARLDMIGAELLMDNIRQQNIPKTVLNDPSFLENWFRPSVITNRLASLNLNTSLINQRQDNPSLMRMDVKTRPSIANGSTSSSSMRISSKFKKNVFFVSPDAQPITTTMKPEEVFELIETLGTGSSGCVYKMMHKPSGKICAVKQMRRGLNDDENKRIYMDLEVVLKCNCDNIVRCCGYFIKELEVWICIELMATCFDRLLKSRNRPLPEKFLGAIAASAVKALIYLKEEHNIIHRDVKPSNILIDEEGHIKLCDFGISGHLIESKAKTRAKGCIPYMAPERVELAASSYDIRSDVWSLGITLYELATGRLPYPECKTDFEILVTVIKEKSPSLPDDMDFSPEFRSFISTCLIKDYQKRPKYQELMEHDFIKKYKNTVVSLSELD